MINWKLKNRDGVLYFVQTFLFMLSYFYSWPYWAKLVLIAFLSVTVIVSSSNYSEHNVFEWRGKKVYNIAGGVMATLLLQAVLLDVESFSIYDQFYLFMFAFIQYWNCFKKPKVV